MPAIPWATIISFLITVILKIFEKNDEYKELKKDLYRFLDKVDTKIPVKIHDSYRRQLDALREELRQEQVALKSVEIARDNYKKAYEELKKGNE